MLFVSTDWLFLLFHFRSCVCFSWAGLVLLGLNHWLTGVRFESWGGRWTSRWRGTAWCYRWLVTKAEDKTKDWVKTSAHAGDCGEFPNEAAGTCMDSQSRCFSWSMSIGRWFIWVTQTNQWLSKNLSFKTTQHQSLNNVSHRVNNVVSLGL